MNKLHAIFIGFAMLALPAAAQLEMPDDEAAASMQPDVSAEAAPQKPAEQKQSKYYTPSVSYKAERNALRRGNALFKDDKFHEALEQYQKAIDINGSSIRGRYNKAVALLQLQSDDNKGTENDPRVEAAKIFAELVDDAKKFDSEIAQHAYYNLGNIAFNDEKYDQSIAFYKDALRIKPEDMDARENLRLAQLKKQEQEQNQDQNQDQNEQDKKDHEQQQQQQQQQQDQQNQEEQQQQQQQKPMTGSAQQILQTMQNKENATRKKVQPQEQPTGRPQTDKPW